MLRPALALALLVACGPKVSPNSAIDKDLDDDHPQPVETAATPAAAPAPSPDAPRPVAQPGKGLRTGTIERARLVAILDKGPGTFLQQLEVTPRMNGERFVGWQLVQLLDHAGPLVDVDLAPGDVLLAINGKPLSRPDQLQSVWDSLRTANEVSAQLWRGNAQFTLDFTVEPRLAESGK